MALSTGDYKAIELLLKKLYPVEITDGKVVSVNPTGGVNVRVTGSTQLQEAVMVRTDQIGSGDDVILIRTNNISKWVIIGSFIRGPQGRGSVSQPSARVEIAPPSNFRAIQSEMSGFCILTWDAPSQQPVAFEVQKNALGQESGASVVLTTRGSYAIIPSETIAFFRIRSISDGSFFSSWTDWVEATPGGYGIYQVQYHGWNVTYKGQPVIYRGVL